jgi:hypothetical protein
MKTAARKFSSTKAHRKSIVVKVIPEDDDKP